MYTLLAGRYGNGREWECIYGKKWEWEWNIAIETGGNGNDLMGMGGMGTKKVVPAHL